MNIRTKITILLLAIIAVVAAAMVTQRTYEASRLTALFETSRSDKEVLFDKIVALKNGKLQALISDYSFWDDMVRFTEDRDSRWAAAYLDTAVPIFDVAGIWVFSVDGSPIYSANSPRQALKELPLSKEAVSSLFVSERFRHFFIYTKYGLMEIKGATIHPTADLERKTPPRGYILAALLWDEKFLKDLGLLSETTVRFASLQEKEAPDRPANIMRGESGFLRDLNGWDGKPIMRIAVSFTSESIRHYNQTGQIIFYMFIFFSLAILVALLFSLVRWVTIPLKLVSESLSSRDVSRVSRLAGGRDEFGEISRAIIQSFEQSDALKDIDTERRTIKLEEKAILDNIPDMAWLKDRESRFIAVNGPFTKACGLKPEELIGKTDFDVWPKELAQRYIADDKEVMLSGKRKLVTEPLFSVEGEMSWIETIKTPIHNDKGEVIGTTGIARDVTERRKAEEELKKAYVQLKEAQYRLMQAEKYAALGKFSSAFAHEIKNPLGIVLNGVEFLEMRLKEADTDIREDLDIIKKSTLRADAIIQRLLKFARPMEPKPERIKPEDLIAETLSFFKYSSPYGEININTNYSKDGMAVFVDKNQMQQALVNIILNAAEAMPRGGDILIKTCRVAQSEYYFAKPACVIEIIDNGPGIPEANMSKIFEPFFTTKSEKGTGLGLFITKIIIDNNKGNLSIESKLGKGTSVKIILPLI